MLREVFLPSINKMLLVLKTTADLHYLPRLAESDLLEVSFTGYFPNFRRVGGGVILTGSISGGVIHAPKSTPLTAAKIPDVEAELGRGRDVRQTAIYRAFAADSIWLEDYLLCAVYIGMAVENEIDELLERHRTSVGSAATDAAVNDTLGTKADSVAIQQILGSNLYGTSVGADFKRILELRNRAVHKRSCHYEVAGMRYQLDDHQTGTEHIQLLDSVVSFLEAK